MCVMPGFRKEVQTNPAAHDCLWVLAKVEKKFLSSEAVVELYMLLFDLGLHKITQYSTPQSM